MVSFDVEVDEVTDSGIACTVTIPSGPLDVSVYVMATFYADVTKGKKSRFAVDLSRYKASRFCSSSIFLACVLLLSHAV